MRRKIEAPMNNQNRNPTQKKLISPSPVSLILLYHCPVLCENSVIIARLPFHLFWSLPFTSPFSNSLPAILAPLTMTYSFLLSVIATIACSNPSSFPWWLPFQRPDWSIHHYQIGKNAVFFSHPPIKIGEFFYPRNPRGSKKEELPASSLEMLLMQKRNEPLGHQPRNEYHPHWFCQVQHPNTNCS